LAVVLRRVAEALRVVAAFWPAVLRDEALRDVLREAALRVVPVLFDAVVERLAAVERVVERLAAVERVLAALRAAGLRAVLLRAVVVLRAVVLLAVSAMVLSSVRNLLTSKLST
jgi:hypothetical protein